jgi:Ca2+-binding EF-hand superfamily protein
MERTVEAIRSMLTSWGRAAVISIACGASHTQAAPPDQAAGKEAAAAAAFPSTPETLRAEFTRLDVNGDQRLSDAEFTADADKELIRYLDRNLFVVDFNGDGFLSYQEFAALSSVSMAAEVPDPIADAAAAAIAIVKGRLEGADADRDGRLNSDELRTLAEISWCTPYLPAFDENQDGLSPEEIERGLSVFFGVLSPDGVALRRTDGQVFNWRTYLQETDGNRDLLLSWAEWQVRFRAEMDHGLLLFDTCDKNADKAVSVAELVEWPKGWYSPVRRFLRADKDLNGWVSPDEVVANLASWERGYQTMLFPAFDVNRDGVLDVKEFRLTPIANPLLDWASRRKDRDGDGRLSLVEFHPVAASADSRSDRHLSGIAFLGVTKLFFDRLDQDGSGFLELNECRFDVDVGRVPREAVVRSLDRDGDGRITLKEVYASSQRKNDPRSDRERRDWRLFVQMDANQDGALESSELGHISDLTQAIDREVALQTSLGPRFQLCDSNRDGRLTLTEWLAERSSTAVAQTKGEFRACDFDGNGELDFAEWCTAPSIARIQQRGVVPDPISDPADAAVAEMAANGQGLSLTKAASICRRYFETISDRTIEAWDRNRDQALSHDELRSGIHRWLGVTIHEVALRQDNGQVFNLRAFQHADADHSRTLSLQEFTTALGQASSTGSDTFIKCDENADGQLTIDEVAAGTQFWVDLLAEFIRLDSNSDGRLDNSELMEGAKSWQLNLASRSVPAFDKDGDGALSFMEFRASPLGNPIANWNTPPADTNYDGQLSRDEYHPLPDDFARGLSEQFFSRLDVDKDNSLSARETLVRCNYKMMSAEVIFDVLDRDGDALLSVSETVGPAPPSGNEGALKSYQERAMRIEDRFRTADSDGDGLISKTAFIDSIPLVNAVSGRKSRVAASVSNRPGEWFQWRTAALVAVNVLLLSGIAWLTVGRSRK